MNDDKAAAAYHPGDAPVTRPDLDALIVRLRFTGEHSGIPILLDAADALTAERARADRARAVVAEMADGDEYPLEAWWRARIMRALS